MRTFVISRNKAMELIAGIAILICLVVIILVIRIYKETPRIKHDVENDQLKKRR